MACRFKLVEAILDTDNSFHQYCIFISYLWVGKQVLAVGNVSEQIHVICNTFKAFK